MTAAKAIAAFTNIESDIATQAVARNKSLICEIPIRADNGSVGIVRIKSSSSGTITYTDKDGTTVLTRDQFLAAYITTDANRLEALEIAKNNIYFADENIGNFQNAKGEYF